MSYKIENGFLWSDGIVIAVLTDEATEQDKKNLVLSSQALSAVENFIENVNSGNYKPRKTVKTLEAIINTYKKE